MLDLPLDQITFSVLDTETTGPVPGVDKPIELAFVHLNNGKVSPPYSWFIDPERPIPPESSAVHHLTDEDIKGAQTLEQLWPTVEPILRNTVIVAHNASFDLSMLPGLSGHLSICTLRLARHLWEKGAVNSAGFPLVNHQQQVLRYWLGLKINTGDLGAHRAAADILVTAELFKTQIQHYLECGGDNSLGGLIEFINSPIQISRMPFGKHQNQLIQEVPSEYLQYLLDNQTPEKPLDPDLKSSIKHALDHRKAHDIIDHRLR